MIIKKVIFLFIFILNSINANSCCAEHNYRLFPIGEFNNQVVFIEFDFFRFCKDNKNKPITPENNEFWIRGVVNLVSYKNDTLVLISNIDTLNLKECICRYSKQYKKSQYESIIEKHYSKALLIANNNVGFRIAKPSNIIFNDSLNTKIQETDSTFIVSYKSFSINILNEDFSSCYPSKVIETRVYNTSNFKITVIRLSCNYIMPEAIEHNNKRFRKIDTAFWKEKASWHGITKDYFKVTNKTLNK